METQGNPIKGTVITFVKSIAFGLLFQIIMAMALMAGSIIENDMDNLMNAGSMLYFPSHRHIAWTGLTLLLVVLPLASIFGGFALRSRSSEFYFWEQSWRNAIWGVIAGILLATSVVSVYILTGYGEITLGPERLIPQELLASVLGYGLLMLFVGYYEEIVTRGILMCEWARYWKNWVIAITVSGIWFGLGHTMNLPATRSEKIRIVIAGVLFSWLLAVITIRFKSIKAAIGVHAGWNFGLGCLMGCPVSGQYLNLTVFQTEITGSDWITGGAFGLETAFPMNLLLVVLITLLLWNTKFPELPS